ncbi:hypothetical protein COCVIDRAFT_92569 [Bipolaris victoriae FI3]|uniref:Uncharacterized protein n=1 Tax=Bipolaris victoriae (strain FI3) TaxID=930091 RepID=W7EQW2_BIPV3|nr:hypothetical protein COCVIDRAFT_92569 [Bipolaris victoriae FI3]
MRACAMSMRYRLIVLRTRQAHPRLGLDALGLFWLVFHALIRFATFCNTWQTVRRSDEQDLRVPMSTSRVELRLRNVSAYVDRVPSADGTESLAGQESVSRLVVIFACSLV